jgi:hypothetical protein
MQRIHHLWSLEGNDGERPLALDSAKLIVSHLASLVALFSGKMLIHKMTAEPYRPSATWVKEICTFVIHTARNLDSANLPLALRVETSCALFPTDLNQGSAIS